VRLRRGLGPHHCVEEELHRLALLGRISQALELIEEHRDGLDVNWTNARVGDRRTLLHLCSAAVGRNSRARDSLTAFVVRLLEYPGVQVNFLDRQRHTPFSLAVFNGCLITVGELLNDDRVAINHCDRASRTPVWNLAYGGAGGAPMLRVILDSGRPVDCLTQAVTCDRTMLAPQDVATSEMNYEIAQMIKQHLAHDRLHHPPPASSPPAPWRCVIL